MLRFCFVIISIICLLFSGCGIGKGSLTGNWKAEKGSERYYLSLDSEGKYMISGFNPQNTYFEDRGTWSFQSPVLSTVSISEESRSWKVQKASRDFLILSNIKVKEGPEGDILKFVRVGPIDLLGTWRAKTGSGNMLMLLRKEGYMIRGQNADGQAYLDVGEWDFNKGVFTATTKRTPSIYKRVWSVDLFGSDVMVLKTIQVQETTPGTIIELDKVDTSEFIGSWSGAGIKLDLSREQAYQMNAEGYPSENGEWDYDGEYFKMTASGKESRIFSLEYFDGSRFVMREILASGSLGQILELRKTE